MVNLSPLNAELNCICHLLALLEAYHILQISRIRVNANCNILKQFNCALVGQKRCFIFYLLCIKWMN
jgi:hypothetical protein